MSSHKSRKSSKEFTKSQKKKSSPFHALGPDVLRYGIKPYLGASTCKALTERFGCKGTMSVFTDNEGNRRDCALYCLSKCSPKNLMPLFNIPSHAFFDRNGQRISIPITNWEIFFEVHSYEYARSIRRRTIIFRKGKSPEEILVDYDKGYVQTVSKSEAAKLLCEFLKYILKRDIASFGAAVNVGTGPQRNEKFLGFDHSWIRPVKEWNLSDRHLIVRHKYMSKQVGKGIGFELDQ
jgi:hypothetical protein